MAAGQRPRSCAARRGGRRGSWAREERHPGTPARAPPLPAAPVPTSAPAASLQTGIQKLIRLLEGEQEDQFTAEQYMLLYT
jgi:hypothetical protein